MLFLTPDNDFAGDEQVIYYLNFNSNMECEKAQQFQVNSSVIIASHESTRLK